MASHATPKMEGLGSKMCCEMIWQSVVPDSARDK